MTEEEYEKRESELRAAVKAQERAALDALAVYQYEVKKLTDLERQLKWLPVTSREQPDQDRPE